MAEPSVCIIILNWNGIDDTERCLASVAELDYQNYKIIVVDNGSTNDSVERLRRVAGIHRLIVNDKNYGYTGGNNIGLSAALEADPDFIWFLNNDTIVYPETLTNLVAAMMADPVLGVASPMVMGHDSKSRAAAYTLRVLDANGNKTEHSDPADIERLSRDPATVVFVTGAAILVRRPLIDILGGFDNDFFAYYEDDDLCLRTHKAGYTVRPVASARIHHDEGQDENPRFDRPYFLYFMMRNQILLRRKHGMSLSSWTLWPLVRIIGQDGMFARLQGNRLDAALAGLWDGWMGRGGRFDPDRRMPGWASAVLLRGAPLWRRLLGLAS